MTDLTTLGYPQGYHQGLSAVLWWISITIIALLGIFLYLKAKKSDLINVKEMLISKAITYVCVPIYVCSIQVGVLYPDYFIQLYFLGASPVTLSIAFYFYYWEKNLTSIKRIPTLSATAGAVLAIIGLILSIWVPQSIPILYNFLIFLVLSLISVAAVLYIYLIFVFSKKVKGINTTVSVIWMAGMALTMIALGFENPPGVRILPSFIVLYLSPLLYAIGLGFATYGIITLFTKISSYYAQTQKCAVHRGTIEIGSTMYYCPSCGITYCKDCYNQVIIKDGCWNCRYGAQVELEQDWKLEQVVEVKKGLKPKPKNPK
jgi:hypothetical protein